MAASKSNIREWINHGLEAGATHVICVCDTFEWEDFPVYVGKNESVHIKLASCQRSSMNTVMEVYNLSMDIEMQLAESRAWHL